MNATNTHLDITKYSVRGGQPRWRPAGHGRRGAGARGGSAQGASHRRCGSTSSGRAREFREPGIWHSSAQLLRGFVVSANLRNNVWAFYERTMTVSAKLPQNMRRTKTKSWLGKEDNIWCTVVCIYIYIYTHTHVYMLIVISLTCIHVYICI